MALRIALGQIEAQVGDVAGNVRRILECWRAAAEVDADVVVFPELAVTGYPPEDLLLKDAFIAANHAAIDQLRREGPSGTTAVVGYVGAGDGDRSDEVRWDVALATRDLTNAAVVLRDQRVLASYAKTRLPNHGVFDEARYFAPRQRPCVVEVAGVRLGIVICEDLWAREGPAADAVGAGAQALAVLNASPYHRGKRREREDLVVEQARRHGVPVAYVNVVGGQDEVVFDGDSMIADGEGRIIARGAQFAVDLVVVDLEVAPAGDVEVAPAGDIEVAAGGERRARASLLPRDEPDRLDPDGEVWTALVRATRDYCHRNGFQDAIVGLSGGIDSAVTAAIAADALGAEHLIGVAMPSPYSSDHSVRDAEQLAANLGCRLHTVRIDGPLTAMGAALGELVVTGFDRADGRAPGVAYENLQSRLRGLSVMALSNETGAIVLTTGNKSEYAVGYATLYGDMSGGFAVIKDVPKLLVYDLARWRNREAEVIPAATIEKPPSAELRPGQFDADSLPDYAVLDDIIEAYVEDDLGLDAIVARGHDRDEVARTLRLIDLAEYKRRQAAPGPKITRRAFGRDRRVPITTAWRG
ncbi:MAG: NAD+ synthase [Nitriliruptoraceae bacterium]|nr:NAD+ synthase [Nitriliruptoraceae bacterium]